MTLSAINRLQRLNRPKILITAARHGVTTNDRNPHLIHSIGWQKSDDVSALHESLFKEEDELNKMRRRSHPGQRAAKSNGSLGKAIW